MKKQKTTILLIGLMLLTTFGAFTAFAAEEGADEAAAGINCVICRVANLIFMIIAALAAIVIILAGLKWLTSGDDPGARNAAKTAIVSAFVGIIIVFIAVYVVWWVVSGLPGTVFKSVNPTEWITGCGPVCAKVGTGGGETTGPEVPAGPSTPSAGTEMDCFQACSAEGKTGYCVQSDQCTAQGEAPYSGTATITDCPGQICCCYG